MTARLVDGEALASRDLFDNVSEIPVQVPRLAHADRLVEAFPCGGDEGEVVGRHGGADGVCGARSAGAR